MEFIGILSGIAAFGAKVWSQNQIQEQNNEQFKKFGTMLQIYKDVVNEDEINKIFSEPNMKEYLEKTRDIFIHI